MKRIGKDLVRIELKPIPGTQKSFYGKAYVYKSIVSGDHSLYSYGTLVAVKEEGCIPKIYCWTKPDGTTSRTTIRHLKAFCNYFGYPVRSTKEMIEKFSLKEFFNRVKKGDYND